MGKSDDDDDDDDGNAEEGGNVEPLEGAEAADSVTNCWFPLPSIGVEGAGVKHVMR